jgi:hypothetical protein
MNRRTEKIIDREFSIHGRDLLIPKDSKVLGLESVVAGGKLKILMIF